MTLFIPVDALDALAAEQHEADRRRAESLVATLQQAVDRLRPNLADVATVDGARRMTAAVFLAHANDLLHEIRASAGQPRLQILGLRSAFELIVVGRYLVVGKDADDEFRRRLNDSHTKDERAARDTGAFFPGAAPFLSPLVDPSAPPPRTLPSIAEQLDTHDGRVGDGYSLLACYRLLHRHVSNSGSHASLSSIKRYAKRDGDVLMLEPNPEPVFRQPPVFIVAALLRDLAAETFRALGLSEDDLPTDLTRPAPNHELPPTPENASGPGG